MKIRKNGKYQTKDGQKVRIYATDLAIVIAQRENSPIWKKRKKI